MGLRDKLNQQPAIVTAVVVLAVVIAGYIVVRNAFGPPRPTVATKAFYSVDDGKTWFVDDIQNYPPFKAAGGKEAVAATVVSCKGGKDPFVLYLWRYTDEGKAEMVDKKSNPGTDLKKEVKKPGKTEWIKKSDFVRASVVEQIECPPGQDEFVTVNP